MPFLIPLIPALIAAGGSVAGALINKSAAGKQNSIVGQQLLTEEDQRNLMDRYAKLQQQYGQQAADFYTPYMQQGSPFIRNLLSQHFGQIGQQFNNQQGLLGQKIAAQGFGAAPSGIGAASAGDLSRSEAGTQSESWLNDMLQNEQIKFQAAQGLGGIANMFQPGQFALHRFTNPTVPQSPFTAVPGAIGSLLQKIPGLGGNSNPNVTAGIDINSVPNPPFNPDPGGGADYGGTFAGGG